MDELSEAVAGWHIDFVQLDRGPLRADLLQLGVGSALLTRARFNRQFDQRGSSPAGLRTFAVVGEEVRGARWGNRALDSTKVVTFDRGGGFEAVSRPGFEAHTFAIDESKLMSLANNVGLSESGRLLDRGGEVYRCSQETVDRVRRRMRRIYEEIAARPSTMNSKALQDEMEIEIPVLILLALASSYQEHRPPSARARNQAFARARAYIEEHADEPPTIEEVCLEAGVSWRTLDYAFRERLGVSPKRYLTSLRLDRVRKELHRRDAGERIADIANRWGFWHLGQFAADYRRQFEELPSVTRARFAGTASLKRRRHLSKG